MLHVLTQHTAPLVYPHLLNNPITFAPVYQPNTTKMGYVLLFKHVLTCSTTTATTFARIVPLSKTAQNVTSTPLFQTLMQCVQHVLQLLFLVLIHNMDFATATPLATLQIKAHVNYVLPTQPHVLTTQDLQPLVYLHTH